MTVKALKKQFAAAIATVVVAGVALSSSTYAWFANNNRVAATGMKVQATAEGGIEIKVISGTQSITPSATWGTIADAQMATGVSLYPTSTKPTASGGVINSNWYHASASLANNSSAKEGTYAQLQTVTGKCTFTNGVAEGNGVLAYATDVKGELYAGAYYVATTYNVAALGQGATNLKVKQVTVTGDTNQGSFDRSLRVAVVCGNNVAIYAPVGYNEATSYKVCTATTGTPMQLQNGNMPEADNVTALAGTTESTVLSETVGTESDPTVVNVYMWYEGEDTNHYSSNLSGAIIDTLAVTVDFIADVQ